MYVEDERTGCECGPLPATTPLASQHSFAAADQLSDLFTCNSVKRSTRTQNLKKSVYFLTSKFISDIVRIKMDQEKI